MGGREKGRKAVKVMIFSRPFEAHDGERDGQRGREKEQRQKGIQQREFGTVSIAL